MARSGGESSRVSSAYGLTDRRRERGLPRSMDSLIPDQEGMGVVVVPCAVCLVRGAPHLTAGRELAGFLGSGETEAWLARERGGPPAARLRRRAPVAVPRGLGSLRTAGGTGRASRGSLGARGLELPRGLGRATDAMNRRSWSWPKARFLLLSAILLLPMAVLGAGRAGTGMGASRWTEALTPAFGRAARRGHRSAGQASIVAAVGFAVGWPLGTVLGLQRPRWEGVALLLLLPLAAPPYLRALSLQALGRRLPYAYQPWLDGYSGVLLALMPLAIPIPLLSAGLKARRMAASAIESVWLAVGSRGVLVAGLRSTWGIASAGAMFAATLAFSDPAAIRSWVAMVSPVRC